MKTILTAALALALLIAASADVLAGHRGRQRGRRFHHVGPVYDYQYAYGPVYYGYPNGHGSGMGYYPDYGYGYGYGSGYGGFPDGQFGVRPHDPFRGSIYGGNRAYGLTQRAANGEIPWSSLNQMLYPRSAVR